MKIEATNLLKAFKEKPSRETAKDVSVEEKVGAAMSCTSGSTTGARRREAAEGMRKFDGYFYNLLIPRGQSL